MDSAGKSFISAPVPAELASLPLEELQGLAECEALLDDFVDGLPPVAALRDQAQRRAGENQRLAEATVAEHGQWEAAKHATLEAADALCGLRASFDALSTEREALAEARCPEAIQEHMAVGAAQSDEASEGIAKAFLAGELPVQDFLKEYIPKRVECHTRKFKSDQLKRQLEELHRAGF